MDVDGVDALRALAAAAWAHAGWSVIVPEGPAAARAIAALGLDRFTSPPVTEAYAASTDPGRRPAPTVSPTPTPGRT